VSEKKHRYRAGWDADEVRSLRRHLGLSQDALAEELGMRQQTVSEWETGRYQPRGASARLLGMIAERAGFEYLPQPHVQGAPGNGAERARK
jgi:DNA-binding transcriptional regulator YiaG